MPCKYLVPKEPQQLKPYFDDRFSNKTGLV